MPSCLMLSRHLRVSESCLRPPQCSADRYCPAMAPCAPWLPVPPALGSKAVTPDRPICPRSRSRVVAETMSDHSHGYLKAPARSSVCCQTNICSQWCFLHSSSSSKYFCCCLKAMRCGGQEYIAPRTETGSLTAPLNFGYGIPRRAQDVLGGSHPLHYWKRWTVTHRAPSA